MSTTHIATTHIVGQLQRCPRPSCSMSTAKQSGSKLPSSKNGNGAPAAPPSSQQQQLTKAERAQAAETAQLRAAVQALTETEDIGTATLGYVRDTHVGVIMRVPAYPSARRASILPLLHSSAATSRTRATSCGGYVAKSTRRTRTSSEAIGFCVA